MMVTFVSQCEKNALKKTRRVLDAFANRIGDNTWQTIITQDGLDTVKKMLRSNASKSTAVSCHWIRSRSRSQFLWVVGNKTKFNSEGYVAVNWTEKELMSNDLESNWKYLELIKSITGLAALFHDWGKASKLFQSKLDPAIKHGFKGDPLRHEWVSSVLFNAFVNSCGDQDEHWLSHLLLGRIEEDPLKQQAKNRLLKPLSHLPPAASLIAWLIVSHHRLPLPDSEGEQQSQLQYTNENLNTLLDRVEASWGYRNRYDESEYQRLVGDCFEFPQGLLSASKRWIERIKLHANQLLNQQGLLHEAIEDGSWRVIINHARLCLMLGDHYYSSQDKDESWTTDIQLYANTANGDNGPELKQKLDEHLYGVAKVAINTVKMLPYFESEPPKSTDNRALKPSSKTPDKFKWQDTAVTKLNAWRKLDVLDNRGAYIVNMASTGCGKTTANAKVMQALSEDGDSLRFVLALGLRTLTLQTGDEYRERAGLTNSELAVLIGSRAVAALHNEGKAQPAEIELQPSLFESLGAESQDALQAETDELDWNAKPWEDVLPEEELTTVLTKEKDRQLLYAPVLACTIDHLMSATECKRGGRYILPYLRLMSSDLVIDEIDDFTGNDLIAIGRLIHLAGMLGRKVMISSATIPPDLSLGYYNAYQHGWNLYALSRGKHKEINCIWVDEFDIKLDTLSSSNKNFEAYEKLHNNFIEKRIKKLIKQPIKRKAEIALCPLPTDSNSLQHNYFSIIQENLLNQHHRNNTLDHTSNIKISFGVVRMANIQPCVALTHYLLETPLPDDVEICCMSYHSQQVLLMRHEQEQHLDVVLKRKEKSGQPPKAFNNPLIREHISFALKNNKKHLIFVLVATPVEEVGRDHDFDWAVVEPSSYRSIIQLAGRVRRHREVEVEQPNITLLQYNWLGYQQRFSGDMQRAFCRPGYETNNQTSLETHDLKQLMDEKKLSQSVDAIPRIAKPEVLAYQTNLAHLEHHATALTFGTPALLAGNDVQQPIRRRRKTKPNTSCDKLQGYLTDYWWLTALPQQFTGFRKSAPSIQLHYVIDKDGDFFCERQPDGEMVKVEKLLNIVHKPLSDQAKQRIWLKRDYQSSINERTTEHFNSYQTSLRYGEVSFSDFGQAGEVKYYYNDQFGLIRDN